MADYLVRLDEKEIKGLGERRWNRKHRRIMLIPLGSMGFLAFGAMSSSLLWLEFALVGVAACGLIAGAVFFGIKKGRAGKAFLAEIKARKK